MTSRISASLLTAFLVVAAIGAAKGENLVKLPVGFITGESFLSLSEAERAFYTMGVADGLQGSPLATGRDSPRVLKVGECIEGKTNTQLAAMTTQYLNDHPGIWDASAYEAIMNVIRETCDLGPPDGEAKVSGGSSGSGVTIIEGTTESEVKVVN